MKKKTHQNPLRQREILKDFDILASIKLKEKKIYQKASLQVGLQMLRDDYVTDDQKNHFKLSCHIDEFIKYGPGIYLLFKFIKYTTIALAILSVITFINVMLLWNSNELHIQDQNFQSTIAMMTVGNLQNSKYNAIVALDFITIFAVFIAIIGWKEVQAFEVVKCAKKVMLPSYCTVILRKIPQQYSQNEMKQFLETNFGPVQEIFTVKNFGQDLSHYKQITQIIDEFKVERARVLVEKDNRNCKKINYYISLHHQIEQQRTYLPCFAFISFQSIITRQILLHHYNNRSLCFNDADESSLTLYKNQILEFEQCEMQTDGIKWENLDLSRTNSNIRLILQIILLIIVMLITVTIILVLSLFQLSMYSEKYSTMTKSQIVSLNNQEATKFYCLSLSISNFYAQYGQCGVYINVYIQLTLLIIMIPLLIAIVRVILTYIMSSLVTFRRYPYELTRIQSEIILLFVLDFFISAILQMILFMEININGYKFSLIGIFFPLIKSIKTYLPVQIILTQDFTKNWYRIVSHKIVIIAMISFNISSIGKIVYSFFRYYIYKYKAKQQIIQMQANQWLKGQNIQLQFVYAKAITILYFTLLYCGTIPIVVVFGFLSMLCLYWSTKVIFINYCRKPMNYSHSVNSLIIKILFGGIIIHCLMAPLFYTAPQIAGRKSLSFFNRFIQHIYFIVLIIIVLIYAFFRKKIVDLLRKTYINIRMKIQDELNKNIENNHEQQQQRYQQNVIQSRRQKRPTILCNIDQKVRKFSYSMHESNEYKQILKSLYTMNRRQRTRGTFVLHSQLGQFIQEKDIDRTNYKTFLQLVALVHANSQRFSVNNGYNAGFKGIENPFDRDWFKLKKIYDRYLKQKQNQLHNDQKQQNLRSQPLVRTSIQVGKIDQIKQHEEQSEQSRSSHKSDSLYNSQHYVDRIKQSFYQPDPKLPLQSNF